MEVPESKNNVCKEIEKSENLDDLDCKKCHPNEDKKTKFIPTYILKDTDLRLWVVSYIRVQEMHTRLPIYHTLGFAKSLASFSVSLLRPPLWSLLSASSVTLPGRTGKMHALFLVGKLWAKKEKWTENKRWSLMHVWSAILNCIRQYNEQKCFNELTTCLQLLYSLLHQYKNWHLIWKRKTSYTKKDRKKKYENTLHLDFATTQLIWTLTNEIHATSMNNIRHQNTTKLCKKVEMITFFTRVSFFHVSTPLKKALLDVAASVILY